MDLYRTPGERPGDRVVVYSYAHVAESRRARVSWKPWIGATAAFVIASGVFFVLDWPLGALVAIALTCGTFTVPIALFLVRELGAPR